VKKKPKKNILNIFYQRVDKLRNHKGPEGSIFRNMAKLATGVGMAKLIALLAMPLITRIYLPDHMGVLSVFTSLVVILVPLGTLRYSMALPLPKSDGVATNLAVLSFWLLILVTVLLFTVLWLFGQFIFDLLSMELMMPYWWLLPIAVFGTGLYELLMNWAVREKAFSHLAKTKVWQVIAGSAVKIGFGLLGIKPLGLLIGEIFKQAGGVIPLIINFSNKFIIYLKHVSSSRISFLFKRFGDFPKYRLPSQFLLVFSQKFPLLFFAWQFDADTTGQLGLAFLVIALPISLLGQTSGQAFYGEIAKIGRKNPVQIYNVTKNITKKLIWIGVFPSAALLFFGPQLFKIVFGDIWGEAGTFASILAIYLLFQFIYTPIANGIFNVFEKQSIVLSLNTSRMLIILAIFSAAFVYDLLPETTLLLYSLTLSLYYVVAIIIVYGLIKKNKKHQLN